MRRRLGRAADGRALDQRADADELISADAATLLRRDGGRIVASVVGPTGLAWEGRGRRHTTLAAVFAVP